jgi:hypothetical protein
LIKQNHLTTDRRLTKVTYARAGTAFFYVLDAKELSELAKGRIIRIRETQNCRNFLVVFCIRISLAAGNSLAKPAMQERSTNEWSRQSKFTRKQNGSVFCRMRCDGGARHTQKRERDDPANAVYACRPDEHLAIPQGEILAKGKSGGKGKECKLYASALRRIGRYIVEHALLGELQYSVAAKLLDELGTGEKLPPDEEDRRIVIVLEDKEGWGE